MGHLYRTGSNSRISTTERCKPYIMKTWPLDPLALVLSFIIGSVTMIREELVLLILSSGKIQSLLVELKAPENSQASRTGLVAQAYQVFPSGLPS